MKKIPKGCPGYFRYRKIQTGMAMISGYLLVLLVFFTGLFIFADRRNLFSAAAIIAMLPTAKMTVHFLMYPRKSSCSADTYNELCGSAGKAMVLAELLITPEKKNIELTYTAAALSHIIIYSADKKLDRAYHEKFIRNFLKGSDITADVTFYDDLGKFKKRLTVLKNEAEGYSEQDLERLGGIVEQLKILSI